MIMSRLLFLLSTLVILFSTKTYACESYCDSFSFPTIYYDGMCYATIGGADPDSSSVGCENSFHTMPEGWSVAEQTINTIHVANTYNWATKVLVFNYGVTQSGSGGNGITWATSAQYSGSCGSCYVMHEAPDQYRSSYCELRVLISTSCQAVTPAAGEKCGECVSSCNGLDDGDYTSCVGCNVYATCSNGHLIDNRACASSNLIWDDENTRCNYESECETGPCANEEDDDTPEKCTQCVDDCEAVSDGNYMSCNGCNLYATCSHGMLIDNRECPGTLVWNDEIKNCDYQSTCNGGDCPGQRR